MLSHRFMFLALVMNLFFAMAVQAKELDQDRLWLPKKYEKLFPKLLASARSAIKLDRCHVLLEGTIDLDQSKPDHPKFRILCREEGGESFNEIVDGLSFKTTSRNYTELEKMQMEEINFSQACRAEIAKELTLMKDLIWLTSGNPRAESLDENSAVFIFDFNASSEFGEALFYRATCNVNKDGSLKVEIGARRD